VDTATLVLERVHEYYWRYDWNCAVTTLRVLAEVFEVPLTDQVTAAAVGMHGAGGYRAQCGLVEGALMFLGIIGQANGHPEKATIQACWDYAQQFEIRFGSLLCRELRPEGFGPDNPPHLCEALTRDAVSFDIQFVSDLLGGGTGEP
jgi:hypothetical protein